ncbi:hypothetical protein E2C01_065534 [Portunus trituberculatus]|uniref:Uncharacterized protein n=1 Tax=Portunus trituberculatus TaxID=210409 RepID=A0A5B7HJ38_PORTR|nr:hypothetical protein [Portunus trituberculatus]
MLGSIFPLHNTSIHCNSRCGCSQSVFLPPVTSPACLPPPNTSVLSTYIHSWDLCTFTTHSHTFSPLLHLSLWVWQPVTGGCSCLWCWLSSRGGAAVRSSRERSGQTPHLVLARVTLTPTLADSSHWQLPPTSFIYYTPLLSFSCVLMACK